MAISVDEAIAEQLASRGEISAPDVPTAVGWLNEQFISARKFFIIGLSQINFKLIMRWFEGFVKSWNCCHNSIILEP